MNKRGQALVEFLLILPVLIMIIFAMIDFGRIYYTKITLSGYLNDIDKLYKNNNSIEEINNVIHKDDKKINISINTKKENYVTYTISKEIEIITPGLSLIIDNPFTVKETRTSYYE